MKLPYCFVLFASLLFLISADAQQIQRCSTTEYLNSQLQKNPELIKSLRAAELEIEAASNNVNKRAAYTIPVVVHIVYNSERPWDNISDEQIKSQFEVLNEDFQMKNADIDKVPNRFKDLIANFNIEFCLTNRDENGNFTTGITRTETTVDEFTTNDNQIKIPERGGVAAWDSNLFLNIWVGRLAGKDLGYATSPGHAKSIDGVVVGTPYFGRGIQYNLHTSYNQGRTTTHEIGHWLSLKHIWGNEYGCQYDDGIEDTPLSEKAYFDCPKEAIPSSCGSPDMTVNFMEYVDDNCMHMFTIGQKERVVNVLNSSRASVVNADRCLTKSNGLDAGLGVSSKEILFCEKGAFPITVTVANLGTENIKAVHLQYTVNNGSVFDFNKTIEIPVDGVEQINLSNLNIFGVNTVDIVLIEVNGRQDEISSNNAISFKVTIPEFGDLPLIERFESNVFEQDGWIINNPDSDDFKWVRSENYGAPLSTGGCLMFNNFVDGDSPNPRNTFDHLITPAFDFTNNTTIGLSFDRAYASRNDELFDALWLAYSVDCGNTWNQFWKREGTSLATHPVKIDNGNSFMPTADDWVTETMDLSSELSGEQSVQFRITNVSGGGQILWIDNIRLENIVDINTFKLTEWFAVAPNPSSNGQFILNRIKEDGKDYSLKVYDIIGEQIFEDNLSASQRQYVLDLANAPNGVYLLLINNEERNYVSRLMVTR